MIVTLNAAGQPAYEVLQDIGIQLRGRAQFAINPTMKRIDIRVDRDASPFGRRQ